MTIKDLINDEELLNSIVEDIDDIPEDAEVSYEVWAIGYDEDDAVTDAELFIGEFVSPEAAIAAAEKLTIEDVVADTASADDVAYITIEVETVVEDEDGEIMNIGSIYSKEIWRNEEDEECKPIVIAEADYEILEDNTLKVKRVALQGCNKNDVVPLSLTRGDYETFTLWYKIMSTVIYDDGDYYHCELQY